MPDAMKYVYLFSEIEAAEAHVGQEEGRHPGAPRRQGRQPGGDDPARRPGPAGLHRSPPRPAPRTCARASYPEETWAEELLAVSELEKATGKRFGAPGRTRCSCRCRSGARFSMPGMMDTILNLGLNDERRLRAMCKRSGDPRFAYDSTGASSRCSEDVVLGSWTIASRRCSPSAAAPRRGRERLGPLRGPTCDGVTSGFAQDRAHLHRRTLPFGSRRAAGHGHRGGLQAPGTESGPSTTAMRNGIAHDLGTAVNIQTMVFGNMGDDSGTGVAMSPQCVDRASPSSRASS